MTFVPEVEAVALFLHADRIGRVPRMDNPAKPLGKFVLACAAVIVSALVIYLVVVGSVYLLAWVLGLIESIF